MTGGRKTNPIHVSKSHKDVLGQSCYFIILLWFNFKSQYGGKCVLVEVLPAGMPGIMGGIIPPTGIILHI